MRTFHESVIVRRKTVTDIAWKTKSLLNELEMAQKHKEPGKTYARRLWRQ